MLVDIQDIKDEKRTPRGDATEVISDMLTVAAEAIHSTAAQTQGEADWNTVLSQNLEKISKAINECPSLSSIVFADCKICDLPDQSYDYEEEVPW